MTYHNHDMEDYIDYHDIRYILHITTFQFIYMTLAVDITDGSGLCGLSNEVRCELLPCCICHSLRCLSSCTLLTRRSTSVLNLGMPCGLKLIKEDWPIVLQ